jgi:hypothetical protein
VVKRSQRRTRRPSPPPAGKEPRADVTSADVAALMKLLMSSDASVSEATSAAQSPSGTRTVSLRIEPGQTAEQANSALAVNGALANANALADWSGGMRGVSLDLTATYHALQQAGARVTGGDLSQIEAVLASQVVVLNGLFAHLASRASYASQPESCERWLRLALRAQGQCRATGETLATIKNPPAVFTRQANFANGPQQVNNHGRPDDGGQSRAVEVAEVPRARAANEATEPSRLLEAGRERLDTRATRAAATGDSPMATVGALDGTPNAGGEGAVRAECLPRRPSPGGTGAVPDRAGRLRAATRDPAAGGVPAMTPTTNTNRRDTSSVGPMAPGEESRAATRSV